MSTTETQKEETVEEQPGTFVWTIDDLRRQLYIIEESYEDTDMDIVFMRGSHGAGHAEVDEEKGCITMEAPMHFGGDAFGTPGVDPVTASDKRLFPLIGVAKSDLSEEALEYVDGESDD